MGAELGVKYTKKNLAVWENHNRAVDASSHMEAKARLLLVYMSM